MVITSIFPFPSPPIRTSREKDKFFLERYKVCWKSRNLRNGHCQVFNMTSLTLSQTINFKLYQTEKLADDNFKFDENVKSSPKG